MNRYSFLYGLIVLSYKMHKRMQGKSNYYVEIYNKTQYNLFNDPF